MRVETVGGVTLVQGDALESLREFPDKSIHCCVTSPPYFGLRDYQVAGQIGLEPTVAEYVTRLVEVFREVHRVLRDDGTCWIVIADSYNAAGRKGHGTRQGFKQATNRASAAGADHTRPSDATLKPKDLIGVPWMLAFALRGDGWYLRQDIIWAKTNPMPESVTDRCTKSHEYIFLLSKSEKYYFDSAAIKEDATCERLRGSGPMVNSGTGRNDAATGTVGDYRKRSKRDSFKRDGSKREQTIPGQGYGTHRPDRDESEWDISKRNKRDVWIISTKSFKGAHFGVFPVDLITPCVLAGCPPNGFVLDPFSGSGTTGLVAQRNGRQAMLIELNSDYIDMAARRIQAG